MELYGQIENFLSFKRIGYEVSNHLAEALIKKGLLRHSKDYGLTPDWWREWTNVGVFDEDCVYYKKIEIGRAYRDSQLLKK